MIFASWGLGSARASAQARRPSLHWTRSARAATCIDPRALAARVETLTGPVLVRPSEAEYLIEGHVDLQGARFVVRVTVTGPDGVPRGERLLEQASSDCRKLDAAIAFVVALTIDPDLELEALLPPAVESGAPEEALLAEIGAAPAAVQATSTRVAEQPREDGPPIPPPVAKPSVNIELRAALLATFGELPSPGLGLVAAGQARLWRWFAVELQTRGSAPLRAFSVPRNRSLRAQSFGFALFACGRHELSLLGLEGCLGFEPLLMRARGIGFDRPSIARLVTWGALARVGFEFAWRERWALRTGVQLRFAADDKRLVYSDEFGTHSAFALRRVSTVLTVGIGRLFSSGKRGLGGTDGRDEEERGP
jgi:hypothetical protein